MFNRFASAVFINLAEVMLHCKGPTSERNYKSGKKGPRYVREMVFTDAPIDPGRPREFSAVDEALEAPTEQLGESRDTGDRIDNIEGEVPVRASPGSWSPSVAGN